MNDYVGKICPYCKTEIAEDDDIVVCSQCDMPHHKECWIANQGCTTFGCMGTINNPDGTPSSVTTNTMNYDANTGGQVYCTSCGAVNSSANAFCIKCGTRLTIPQSSGSTEPHYTVSNYGSNGNPSYYAQQTPYQTPAYQNNGGYGYQTPAYQNNQAYGYQAPAYQNNQAYGYQAPAYQNNQTYGYQAPAYQNNQAYGYQAPAYQNNQAYGYQAPAYQNPAPVQTPAPQTPPANQNFDIDIQSEAKPVSEENIENETPKTEETNNA